LIFTRKQVVPFTILFEGRTGSSHLWSLLDNHPQVRVRREGLVARKKQGWDAQLTWSTEALTAPLIGRSRAVGFKTKLHDILEPDEFAGLLKSLDVKIILMHRENRVKAVVSHIRSSLLKQKTGDYNATSEQERLPAHEIGIDWFDKEMKMREERDSALEVFVDQLSLRTLRVSYEELLTDESRTMHKIYDFIDVPYLATESKYIKHTSDDLKDVLKNFSELRAHYAGTPYESMFDEVSR
jgi:hypothetical protein